MKKTRVITFANHKGGASKTTLSTMFAYILATKYDYKVLAVDLDPQKNLTGNLKRTFKTEDMPVGNLFDDIKNKNISNSVLKLTDNLYLAHGTVKLEGLETYLSEHNSESEKLFGLKKAFANVIGEYDYIICDTKPSLSLVNENTIAMSNYVIVPTQAKHNNLLGTQKVYEFIQTIRPQNPSVNLLGVVITAFSKDSKPQKKVRKELKDSFKSLLFKSVTKRGDRIERWEDEGITEYDFHDKNAMRMNKTVVAEALKRISILEGN
ncbi:ParA family protein [Staphylococcus shinii]|uniref:ParA family protein n=1 Tax=Staphylococcus shinii TaxID=2912228 RepID=UPI003F5610EB